MKNVVDSRKLSNSVQLVMCWNSCLTTEQCLWCKYSTWHLLKNISQALKNVVDSRNMSRKLCIFASQWHFNASTWVATHHKELSNSFQLVMCWKSCLRTEQCLWCKSSIWHLLKNISQAMENVVDIRYWLGKPCKATKTNIIALRAWGSVLLLIVSIIIVE